MHYLGQGIYNDAFFSYIHNPDFEIKYEFGVMRCRGIRTGGSFQKTQKVPSFWWQSAPCLREKCSHNVQKIFCYSIN
jgi:hypothetical protein